MADAYTTVASVDYVQTAYDQLAYPALRPELFFDQLADVQPTRQSMPGLTVQFTIQNDLAVASSTLNESTDVSAVAISDSTLTVVLAEYGNAVITTARLRAGAFVDIDEIVANVVGFNAGVSMDSVARSVVQAGNNVNYSAGATGITPASRAALTSSNTLRAYDVRVAVATLRTQNVPPVGGAYWAVIHPAVSFDLRTETGTDGWIQPHNYSSAENIWNGELGTFNGVRFIETPRAPEFVAGASSTTTSHDAFGTLFGGKQAFAKAYSIADGNGEDPHIITGPVTDKLRRFLPVGWYQIAGYSVFRQAALLRVESCSSIDALLPSVSVDQN
jgi:N4-gp56 family major capsid protein